MIINYMDVRFWYINTTFTPENFFHVDFFYISIETYI